MLVLGINAFHADSAAALVRDGKILAAIAEERLNRVKHYYGFPKLAIHEALKIAGVNWGDVDAIAVARDGKANATRKVGYVLKNIRKTHKLIRDRLEKRADVASIEDLLKEEFGRVPKVHNVEHHLAHAASCFLPSPYEDAAIMTVDGMGDFASTMIAHGQGTQIKVIDRVHYPHSLGILYTALCQYIGYDRYGDEGKVMGLAPYGDPSVYREQVAQLVKLTNKGRFELNLDYFVHHESGVDYGADEQGLPYVASLFSPKLCELFDAPATQRGAKIEQREMDIAAALQERLEEAYMHVLSYLHSKVGGERLCIAGGVALNSVANGKLLERTPFRELYLHPAAGDDGTAVGAALWVAKDQGRRVHGVSASLGNAFSDAEIGQALEEYQGRFEIERVSRDQLLAHTAQAIADGKVTGWFQGGMEWGPRALGNRSIVAHPGHPDMKEILNARIKHREWFRPFAPSILEDRLGEYFESDHPAPFMLKVYGTKAEKRDALVAVNHVDHTGRVQTVSKESNPLYYDLIAKVGEVTGVPIVLNTSFNENEPIVCQPREAIECFSRTKMDCLAIGSFFCRKLNASS